MEPDVLNAGPAEGAPPPEHPQSLINENPNILVLSFYTGKLQLW